MTKTRVSPEKRKPGTILHKSEFSGPLKNVAAKFLSMSTAGLVKIVIEQDWRVDRLCPPFIDSKHIAALLRRDDKVLHIGQGDSSSCRHFHDIGPKHTSVCFADAVYLDPRSVIAERLRHEPMFCGRPQDKDRLDAARMLIAEILRDEFLVPASMLGIASKDLGSLGSFTPKDFEIMRIKARHFRTSPPNPGTARYVATYGALLEILERKMKILIPNSVEGQRYRRSISRLGGRMAHTLLGETEAQSLAMLESNPAYLQPISYHDAHYVAVRAFQDVCLQPHRMVLGDFRETALPEETYDLIEGCRSDAFLGHRYASFLTYILDHLSEHGVYVSDGILSSYSYQFFIEAFLRDFLSARTGYRVWIVIPNEEEVSAHYPPTFISGVIVSRSLSRIPAIQEMLAKRGNRMVQVSTRADIMDIPEARCQLAWSQFVDLAAAHRQDLETLPHQDVVSRLQALALGSTELPDKDALMGILTDLAI